MSRIAVHHVLALGDETHVAAAVVEAIPVDVVDYKPSRSIHDDPVHESPIGSLRVGGSRTFQAIPRNPGHQRDVSGVDVAGSPVAEPDYGDVSTVLNEASSDSVEGSGERVSVDVPVFPMKSAVPASLDWLRAGFNRTFRHRKYTIS